MYWVYLETVLLSFICLLFACLVFLETNKNVTVSVFHTKSDLTLLLYKCSYLTQGLGVREASWLYTLKSTLHKRDLILSACMKLHFFTQKSCPGNLLFIFNVHNCYCRFLLCVNFVVIAVICLQGREGVSFKQYQKEHHYCFIHHTRFYFIFLWCSSNCFVQPCVLLSLFFFFFSRTKYSVCNEWFLIKESFYHMMLFSFYCCPHSSITK